VRYGKVGESNFESESEYTGLTTKRTDGTYLTSSLKQVESFGYQAQMVV